ncbi:MAG TPA: hypothetical protein PLM22_06605 [Candidatus Sabulitectum sp.]|mgnify:FL=1|nr:hypothetical protein [Candidatus Sabulitectum sp.]HPR22657.1 hypothetical protein [Candidatus Sabulitectum sp.]
MLRKELIATLRQAASVLGFLLLVPAVFWINQARLPDNPDFSHYLDWGLMIVLPFLPLYLAYMMFEEEDRDSAHEYLQTLPLRKAELLALKIIPRAIVLLPVFFTPWLRSNVIYWQIDGVNRFLYSLLLPGIILFSGFLLGISNRRNPYLVTALLLPVLFLVKSGFGSILTMKLTWGFYFSIMEPMGCESEWLFLLAHRIFYLLGTILPAALPSMVLIPVYTRRTGLSGERKAQIMLGKMLIPLLVILVLFTTKLLKLYRG